MTRSFRHSAAVIRRPQLVQIFMPRPTKLAPRSTNERPVYGRDEAASEAVVSLYAILLGGEPR